MDNENQVQQVEIQQVEQKPQHHDELDVMGAAIIKLLQKGWNKINQLRSQNKAQ